MKNYLSVSYLLLNKVLFFIVLAVMPFIYSCSKDNPVEPNYTNPDFFVYQCDNNKYGFKDRKTGEQVIECKYDDAEEFTEGLALVRVNGKYGFIDSKGKEVISFKYDRCYPFSEGMAAVASGYTTERKWGFIDKTGKEVIPLKYEDFYKDIPNKIFGFREGLVAVQSGKWGFVDKKENVVRPFIYDRAYYFKDGAAKVVFEGYTMCILKNGEQTPCD